MKKMVLAGWMLTAALLLSACGGAPAAPAGESPAPEETGAAQSSMPSGTAAGGETPAAAETAPEETEPDNRPEAFADATDESNAEDSGACGTNLNWYYRDGVLVIRGSGPMEYTEKVPWEDYRDDIEMLVVRGAENIQGWSFKEYEHLSQVVLDSSVRSIGEETFRECTALRSVELPQGLETLETRAFLEAGLEEISLPSTLTTIGDGVFAGTALTQVVVPDSVTSLGDNVFMNCPSLRTAVLPDGLGALGMSLFCGCASLQEVNLPSGITELPSAIFKECAQLKSVTIPETVTQIGWEAFRKSGITAITLPDGVTELGEDVFSGCTDLSEVYLGSVTAIPNNTFERCEALKQVEIPSTVTHIGSLAFAGTSITSLTIPASVSELRDCLSDCYDLRDVTLCHETIPELPRLLDFEIEGYRFLDIPEDIEVTVHLSSKLPAQEGNPTMPDLVKIKAWHGGDFMFSRLGSTGLHFVIDTQA